MISLNTVVYYFIPLAAVIFAVLYINNHFFNPSSAKQHNQQSSTSAQQQSRRQAEPVSADRVFTLAELRKYDGSDPTSAILLGCNGLVFDMTPGESFYGPGGPYAGFAGHDASRSLARMELEVTSTDIGDLKASEMQVLDEWYQKYQMKYNVVGKIIDHSQPNSGVPPPNGWKQSAPAASASASASASTTNTTAAASNTAASTS